MCTKNKGFKGSRIGDAVGALYDKKRGVKSYWYDLEKIYQVKTQAILEMGQLAQGLLRDPVIVASIEHTTRAANAIKTMASDMTTYSDKLKTIRAMHQGKVGVVRDEDMMLAYQIGDMYMQTDEEFQSITVIPMAVITAELQHLEDSNKPKTQEQLDLEAAAIRDVSVITDLEPTMIKEGAV